MILSDVDIKAAMKGGGLTVSPLEPYQIQPASIDLRLGSELFLSVGDDHAIRRGEDPAWARFSLQNDSFRMLPGDFVLGTTREHVCIPSDLCAMVQGRSTTGRQGLVVEIAGLVDPGFQGEITLEMHNISARPIELSTGMGVAQLVFWRMTSPAEAPYGSVQLGSRYQGQTGPTPPRARLG